MWWFALGIWNVLALGLMGYDKFMAKGSGRRVPEKTLFLTALLAGSVGIWCGMYLWHHKTRKPQFTLGVPAILALQGVLVLWSLNGFSL